MARRGATIIIYVLS